MHWKGLVCWSVSTITHVTLCRTRRVRHGVAVPCITIRQYTYHLHSSSSRRQLYIYSSTLSLSLPFVPLGAHHPNLQHSAHAGRIKDRPQTLTRLHPAQHPRAPVLAPTVAPASQHVHLQEGGVAVSHLLLHPPRRTPRSTPPTIQGPHRQQGGAPGAPIARTCPRRPDHEVLSLARRGQLGLGSHLSGLVYPVRRWPIHSVRRPPPADGRDVEFAHSPRLDTVTKGDCTFPGTDIPITRAAAHGRHAQALLEDTS